MKEDFSTPEPNSLSGLSDLFKNEKMQVLSSMAWLLVNAQLISAFVFATQIVQFLLISNFELSSVHVQAWTETQIVGFLIRMLKNQLKKAKSKTRQKSTLKTSKSEGIWQ